jgi:hypothetical protein
MPAIDSQIGLALAVKLKMMFERNDKFLAFPLGGTGFTFDSLAFMKDVHETEISARDQLNYSALFARQMNLIPQDSARFLPDASRFLWTELRAILRSSTFARSALVGDELVKYQAARKYLLTLVPRADGKFDRANSEVVNKYYFYKEKYDTAISAFKNEEISVASLPEGHVSRLHWDVIRKEELKDAVAIAEDEWHQLGFKNEVERNQQTKRDLEQKMYLDTLKADYLDDLESSLFSDLLNDEAYTTTFAPADVFNQNLPWTNVTMSRSEISALAHQAGHELTQMFHSNPIFNNVEFVTLEYNDVTIVRPWLNENLFSSRYWKLAPGSEVSNGKTPRLGRIPAYISSVLVIRNVEITRKKTLLDTAQGSNFLVPPEALTSKVARVSNETNPARKMMESQVHVDDLFTEKIEFDGVIVVAYVCKRLPKCPNPDSTLQW